MPVAGMRCCRLHSSGFGGPSAAAGHLRNNVPCSLVVLMFVELHSISPALPHGPHRCSHTGGRKGDSHIAVHAWSTPAPSEMMCGAGCRRHSGQVARGALVPAGGRRVCLSMGASCCPVRAEVCQQVCLQALPSRNPAGSLWPALGLAASLGSALHHLHSKVQGPGVQPLLQVHSKQYQQVWRLARWHHHQPCVMQPRS